MNKHYFSSQLQYYLLTRKKKPPEGFSFIETMVAMTILSIAFAVNLQFLLLLKVENLDQKITIGAVSLSKEILEGIRYDFKDDLNATPQFIQTSTLTIPTPTTIVKTNINRIGTTTFQLSDDRKNDFGGYKYKVVINICSNDDPNITNNVVSNCLTNTASNIRYIIVQIKNPKVIKYEDNKTTADQEYVYYTAQTIFTTLQKK
ncbi:prepilin-type N-terminal cleavage/methylation domain-containing protein [Geminocystis sp. GBBB08]|uniref:type IV pilus modification PilV family protein n=1 Tax=Geminocystis sp. GBBB08 TaxID=2604140 RepID=UPI0027E2C382|nr:prepilin-type N-terminal cleavage/methylation domain-containing protein [Geminocystis sp. GBBB08]MBL1209877.1 prepilin-type N-terminal cleavage/methylation domain-containing protein [Geminocystis sp. GBBB08]